MKYKWIYGSIIVLLIGVIVLWTNYNLDRVYKDSLKNRNQMDGIINKIDKLSYNNNLLRKQIERMKMYENRIKEDELVNGVYFSDDGYYAVWTKNRTYCDIMELDPSLSCVNETAFHELTHVMIESDKKHFCKNDI